MTPDQIADGLVRYYSERGLDMHSIMGNEIYNKLSPADKVDFVRKYAHTMASGTPTGMTSSDWKEVRRDALTGAGIGAAMGAHATAMHFLAGNRSISPIAIPAAAVLGAFMGTVPGMNKYLSRIQDRNSARQALTEAAQNGDEYSALSAVISHTKPEGHQESILERALNATGLTQANYQSAKEVAVKDLEMYSEMHNKQGPN